MKKFICIFIATSFIALCFLSGCGQTGDLYLPNKTKAQHAKKQKKVFIHI